MSSLEGDGCLHFPSTTGVWRVINGAYQIIVPIAVLMDSLQVIFPIGDGTRARQDIRLTYSFGLRGGAGDELHRTRGIMISAGDNTALHALHSIESDNRS